jgi:hypothetical protein
MDTQKNLAVLKQYYAAVLAPCVSGATGSSFDHMRRVVGQEVVDENSVDSQALAIFLVYLQENGFSDLYLNGNKHIGICYGVVPLEIEVCFSMTNGEVSSFRIELFLRIKKSRRIVGAASVTGDITSFCGRWHWEKGFGLVTDVPLDIGKVIWGAKGR